APPRRRQGARQFATQKRRLAAACQARAGRAGEPRGGGRPARDWASPRDDSSAGRHRRALAVGGSGISDGPRPRARQWPLITPAGRLRSRRGADPWSMLPLMARHGVRFHPPALAPGPAIRWMLLRAFGPVGAAGGPAAP